MNVWAELLNPLPNLGTSTASTTTPSINGTATAQVYQLVVTTQNPGLRKNPANIVGDPDGATQAATRRLTRRGDAVHPGAPTGHITLPRWIPIVEAGERLRASPPWGKPNPARLVRPGPFNERCRLHGRRAAKSAARHGAWPDHPNQWHRKAQQSTYVHGEQHAISQVQNPATKAGERLADGRRRFCCNGWPIRTWHINQFPTCRRLPGHTTPMSPWITSI